MPSLWHFLCSNECYTRQLIYFSASKMPENINATRKNTMRFLFSTLENGNFRVRTQYTSQNGQSIDAPFFVSLAMNFARAIALVVLAALIAFGFISQAQAAGNPAVGQNYWSGATASVNFTACFICHSATPGSGGEIYQLSAANNENKITQAIAGVTNPNGISTPMAGFTPTLTQRQDIAAYIGLFVIPTTANKAVSVGYNSGSNTITLTGDITIGTPASISVSAASNGTVSGASVSTISNSVVTKVNYTPNSTYYGSDSFTYTVTNSAGTSDPSITVTITIPQPAAPVTTAASPNVAYGSSNNVINLAGNISGFTTGNIQIVSAPANGTINSTTGTTVTYTPNGVPFVGGADPFTFNIVGPGGTSNTSTASLTVGAPPAPVANVAAKGVAYNSVSNAFDMTADITNPSTSVNVTVAPTHGTINSTVGNVITYTPTTGYFGTDTFSYTATGPGGGPSAAAVVTITVANPPAPTVAATSASVPFNTATGIDLTSFITGVSTSIAVATAPGHGGASVAGNVVTYTPTTGYSGADSFTYTATGPGGGPSAPATVTITVGTLAPTAGATTMTVALNTATTLDLAPFITGSSISGIAISANPAHGAAVVSGTRVTFTPANNYFGSDAFSYIAYGNAGTSPAGVITVTVTGRPDPTQDSRVTALIASQTATAQRFTRAQTSNFQTRMESLHRGSGNVESGDDGNTPSSNFNTVPGNRTVSAAKGYVNDPNVDRQSNDKPTGSAYRPAASLTANPIDGLSARPVTASTALATLAGAISSSAGTSRTDPATAVAKALTMATTALQSSTLDLASSTGDGASTLSGGVDIWMGGGVRFGTRDGDSFSTDGVSVGVDRRINDQLVLGVGLGYARDRTDVGTDGTNSKSKSATIAAYGSYQPMQNIFIDGILGYGTLDYKTDRYVVPINDFAHSSRSGDFLFGSLTAGYEYRTTGLLLSPYGRLDLATHRLNQVSETGAGAYALTYAGQRTPSAQFALGLRVESAHQTNFGYIAPRARVEFQHDFKGGQPASISYADQVGGTSYVMPATATNRNSLVLGVGSDFVLRRGLTLAFDYQLQRASAQDTSQAVFFKLTKNLDGRSDLLPSYAFSGQPLGVHIDVSYLFDDNVTRSSSAPEMFTDHSYSLNVSKAFTLPLGDHLRMALNTFVGAERFATYTGLDRAFIGGEAELQYRAAGEFGTPIYGLFANATADEYESVLRDGERYSFGVSVRKPVTDRISLYGALAKNIRYGKSAVFNTRDYSARLNLDYAMASQSTLYLTGEYRRGDIVSTGRHTLANINVAKVFSPDDAFTSLYAYRVDGKTLLFTLGYNLPFGPKDSLDFSWRRVQSASAVSSGLASAGTPHYRANQLSIVYLTSF
jgi:uncharacterized protein with beta-barrel porin domain